MAVAAKNYIERLSGVGRWNYAVKRRLHNVLQ
jgi:hypothetical protein